MVARGHGLDTLCLYLAIARTALLDLIVSMGLATPHDRAHRRAGGRNPWSPDDIPVFIELWVAGWQAASLAERFGRSRSSIWSKARQIGLPKRDRSALFRPADPHLRWPFSPEASAPAPNSDVAIRAIGTATASKGPITVLPVEAAPSAASAIKAPSARALNNQAQPCLPVVLAGAKLTRSSLPLKPISSAAAAPANRKAVSASTPTAECDLGFVPPLPTLRRPPATLAAFPSIVRKGLRAEIPWKDHGVLDHEVAMRTFAGQFYKDSAKDMGVSVPTFLTRRYRLELPRMPRNEWVEDYKEEWAVPAIEAMGYRKVKCRGFERRDIDFHFWAEARSGRRFSRLVKTMTWFKEAAEIVSMFH